jgi:hypothetical protein
MLTCFYWHPALTSMAHHIRGNSGVQTGLTRHKPFQPLLSPSPGTCMICVRDSRMYFDPWAVQQEGLD